MRNLIILLLFILVTGCGGEEQVIDNAPAFISETQLYKLDTFLVSINL